MFGSPAQTHLGTGKRLYTCGTEAADQLIIESILLFSEAAYLLVRAARSLREVDYHYPHPCSREHTERAIEPKGVRLALRTQWLHYFAKCSGKRMVMRN